MGAKEMIQFTVEAVDLKGAIKAVDEQIPDVNRQQWTVEEWRRCLHRPILISLTDEKGDVHQINQPYEVT